MLGSNCLMVFLVIHLATVLACLSDSLARLCAIFLVVLAIELVKFVFERGGCSRFGLMRAVMEDDCMKGVL